MPTSGALKDFPVLSPADGVSLAVDVGFVSSPLPSDEHGHERFESRSNGKEMWDQSLFHGPAERPRPGSHRVADLKSNLEISRIAPVDGATAQSLAIFREHAAAARGEEPRSARPAFNGVAPAPAPAPIAGLFGPDGDPSPAPSPAPNAAAAAASQSKYRCLPGPCGAGPRAGLGAAPCRTAGDRPEPARRCAEQEREGGNGI